MRYILLFCSLIIAHLAYAQHHPHDMKMQKQDSVMSYQMMDMDMHDTSMYMESMPSAFSRNLPMERNGSGTSWHPDNSPMYMYMWMPGKWSLMLHYGIFLDYTRQNANNADRRGGSDMLMSQNWAMAMAQRPLGKKGQIMFRLMTSLDPLTIGGQGYPLLFQSGESWQNRPLIDRQHPHDLISELSVGYSYSLNKNIDLFSYFGLPGEPALGPPAFMHRPSALDMPDAPIGHHWQDATHITFGVGTLGLRYKKLKLDGSLFTGREPDENRFNIDQPKFDSYSLRLSYNPSSPFALSVYTGYIQSPEALDPETSVNRVGASVLYNAAFSSNRVLSSTFVWGANTYHTATEKPYTGQSFLLESSLQGRRFNYFTRIESVQKSFGELLLSAADETKQNTISYLSLGLSRYIVKSEYSWLSIGAMGSVYLINQDLKKYYGDTPLSFEVFLRIIPPRM